MSEFYVRRAEIEEGRYRPARYARDKRIDSPADWATQIVADRSFEITVVKPYGYEPYSHVLTLAMGGLGFRCGCNSTTSRTSTLCHTCKNRSRRPIELCRSTWREIVNWQPPSRS